MLKIKLNQPDLFVSVTSYKHVVVQNNELEKDLPKQITQETQEIVENVKDIADNADGASKAVMAVHIITNLLMSSSLALLWGLVNSL